MTTNTRYAKAYTEVLEILSYFSEEEYSKIPKEKIDFFQKNRDKTYKYSINPKIPLGEQPISKETNAIIISLFRDYFATEKQKETLNNLLKQNQDKKEKELRERYNTDNIFENQSIIKNTNCQKNNIREKSEDLVAYKEQSMLEKIWKFIKNIFKRNG